MTSFEDLERKEIKNVRVKYGAPPKSAHDWFFKVDLPGEVLRIRIRNNEENEILLNKVNSLIHEYVDLVVVVWPWTVRSLSGTSYILQSIERTRE